MLSYQHGFHAGNAADVHKHALLASVLSYLTQKEKPISYIETHAGRGLYDLSGEQAQKTGEAKSGVDILARKFPKNHPYLQAISKCRKTHGKQSYPGSPKVAQALLRAQDSLHLAELHPQEYAHLVENMNGSGAHIQRKDGFDAAQSIAPPTPRRGLCLIDPPYEMKTDYDKIPKFIYDLNRKWNVGIIALWYPILDNGAHGGMAKALERLEAPNGLHHQVHFPAARDGHGMIGSGMFFVNAPWGLDKETQRLSGMFGAL